MNTAIALGARALVAGSLMAAAAAAPPAAAQEDLADRVRELEQELRLLRRQLESQIEGNMEVANAAAEAARAAGEAAAGAEDGGPAVRMKGPAPTFASEDGDFAMSVTGRVHWDVGFYDEAEGQDLNDGSNLRRARLGVKGRIMKAWGYDIVLDGGDSAADDVDIDTAFVAYKGLKPVTLTLGQHKAPLTLEDRTSSNDIPFIERSLGTNMFVGPAGGKRFGVSAVGNTDMIWAGAGVFGEKLGVDDGDGADEQWSFAGRLAVAPVNEKTHGVHLGASGWLVPEPSESNEVTVPGVDEDGNPIQVGAGIYESGKCRFRDRPEFRVDDSREIDTGNVTAENCYGVGGEFAAWYTPFWVASEIHRFGFDQLGGGAATERNFDALYLQAGWVLTGEGRPYSMKKAAWSGVKPANPVGADGGMGAVELLGRYSHADLADIDRGEQTNYTIGVNWWLNDWVALKFNYISASVETGGEETEFDIFGLRTQVKW